MTKDKRNKKEKIKTESVDDVIIENIPEEKSSFKEKRKKEVEKEKTGKLEQCLKEKEEYLNGWQRARAEMANLKKQHQEEKKLFTAIGKESMLSDLVPVLDNFNAAFSADSWEKVDQNWRIGIEYIYKQFLDILEKNGIEEFGKIGDIVDFEKYEVIEELEEDGKKKGEILKVIQKGYKKGDKIIRVAKVKVVK